jgi:glycosyltransferase involved in cell wall biosynthesis
MPAVSVIVPVFNYGDFVGEALESVRAQTFSSWECVVVDDGSTDATVDRVLAHAAREDRIRCSRQPHRGVVAARNTGIAEARGAFIQFLDADDLLESQKLERHAAYLEAHPGVDIVYGDTRYFEDDPARDVTDRLLRDGVPRPRVTGRGAGVLATLVHSNAIPIGAPLVRRRLLDRIGPFDEAIEAPSVEDWDLWIRAAAAGAVFAYDDAPGARALVRYHAASGSKDRLRQLVATRTIRAKIPELTTDAEVLRLNRARAVEETGRLGVAEALAGSRRRAIPHLLAAAARSRRPKATARWLVYAAVCPFLPSRHFRRLTSTSVTRKLAAAVRP